jgi:hypothetical protein
VAEEDEHEGAAIAVLVFFILHVESRSAATLRRGQIASVAADPRSTGTMTQTEAEGKALEARAKVTCSAEETAGEGAATAACRFFVLHGRSRSAATWHRGMEAGSAASLESKREKLILAARPGGRLGATCSAVDAGGVGAAIAAAGV